MAIVMTQSQERYLLEIHRDGVRTYNGRAWKPLEALESKGLVQFEADLWLRSNGSAMRLSAKLTPLGEKVAETLLLDKSQTVV